MESREFLYHYTTASIAIDYILNNKTLRLGALSRVNDPKESKYRDFTFYARGAKAVAEFDGAVFDEVCQDLAVNSYALCCGMGEVDDYGRESGALHPHMWANYAERHTGVCLVFDKELLHQSIEEAVPEAALYYGPVNYVDLKEMFAASGSAYSLYLEDWTKDKEGYFDFHVGNYHKGLFFTKHADWRDENEYRWVVRLRNGSDIFVDVTRALVKCVLGHEVSEPDFHSLRERCLSIGLPMHKVIWNASGSLSRDLSIDDEKFHMNVDLSFSQLVPCGAVFRRASDGVGNPQVIAISSKNGNCVHYGTDSSNNNLNLLGFTEDEAMVEINPSGWSAGRWSETAKRPIGVTMNNGKLSLVEGEEVPYYGMLFEVNGEIHKLP